MTGQPMLRMEHSLAKCANLCSTEHVGQSGFPCVVTEYQSRKMQCSVYTESRSAEQALVIHLEIDRSVPAFFEQPPWVECIRSTKR